MNARIMRRTILGLVGVAVAVTASLSAASAKTWPTSGQPVEAVLTWNTNAVNAVRASSPAKAQVEGLIYMSYV